MQSALFLVIFSALITSVGAQTNRSSFRGDRAGGLARGASTPATWNVETSENILWKRAVAGWGHSSPVVWGDRLFLTTAVNQRRNAPLKVGLYGDPESAEDNDVQKWKVLCLDRNTGRLLWDTTWPWEQRRFRRPAAFEYARNSRSSAAHGHISVSGIW